MPNYSTRSFLPEDAEKLPQYFEDFFPDYKTDEASLIRRILLDPNFDPTGFIFLLKDGRECGMGYALIRRIPSDVGADMDEQKGYISLFCVPDKSDVEVGGQLLLDELEKWILSKGRVMVQTNYPGNCYFTVGPDEDKTPQIAELYRKNHYTEKPHIAMAVDLSDYKIPATLLEKKAILEKEGFYMGPLRKKDIMSLLTACTFKPPGWVGHFRYRLQAAPLDMSRFMVAVKDNCVIGVTVFDDPNTSPERYGPFGVEKEFRGKGIGAILLALLLAEMKSRGLSKAWLQSTGPAPNPAYTTYTRAGFKTTASTPIFSKNLTGIIK